MKFKSQWASRLFRPNLAVDLYVRSDFRHFQHFTYPEGKVVYRCLVTILSVTLTRDVLSGVGERITSHADSSDGGGVEVRRGEDGDSGGRSQAGSAVSLIRPP